MFSLPVALHHPLRLKYKQILQGDAPSYVCWFISPLNYRYIPHKHPSTLYSHPCNSWQPIIIHSLINPSEIGLHGTSHQNSIPINSSSLRSSPANFTWKKKTIPVSTRMQELNLLKSAGQTLQLPRAVFLGGFFSGDLQQKIGWSKHMVNLRYLLEKSQTNKHTHIYIYIYMTYIYIRIYDYIYIISDWWMYILPLIATE